MTADLSPPDPAAVQAVARRELPFAERWWQALIEQSRFEDRLLELLDGGDFDSIGTDDYDMSLEIYKVDNDVRLSESAQRFIFDSGFAKAYVNHKDGAQTHYSWSGEDFKSARGWRRKDKPGGGFIISFWPDSWKQLPWRETGYIVVEPDLLDRAHLAAREGDGG